MTLRVGIIGCGSISRAHVRGWLGIPTKAKVVAVADVSRANAESLATLVGGAEVYTDYRDLLATAEVDAVDICLPHHLHKDAIVAAALAHKNVMCEKPLCLSVDEAGEIAAAIETGGVTFMSAHNQVFLPTVREAKRLIQSGLLGQLFNLYSSDCFVNRGLMQTDDQQPAARTWRSVKETMGGGELIDTGYHPTYRLLYLAESAPVEMVAQTARFRLQHLDAEDTAQVLLRFADGAFGTILSSWVMDNPFSSYYFWVIGERGQIYGTDDTLYVRLNGLTEPASRTFPKVDTFAAEIEHFADVLAQGQRPVQSVLEATNVLKVILGAYRSVETKQVVEL